MNVEDIKQRIEVIIQECLSNKIDVTNKTDLMKEHVLDSLTFIKLVNELEKAFVIKFDIFELSTDQFKNINMIATKIKKKIDLKK